MKMHSSPEQDQKDQAALMARVPAGTAALVAAVAAAAVLVDQSHSRMQH